MKKIIFKVFWADGDRDWTIMVVFYAVQGSMLVFLFMKKFKAKKSSY